MDLLKLQLILGESGVCRTGHFVGASGKHLNMFVNFEDMFRSENEAHLDFIIEALVSLIHQNSMLWPDMIVGPAEGGNLLCERLAPVLSRLLDTDIIVAYTDKEGDGFRLRDPACVRDREVLVVDDVATSGKSTDKVAKLVRAAGATVLGICVAVDREGLTSQRLGVPLYRYLIALQTTSYNVPGRQPCALCLARVDFDLTVNGHTRDFVAKHGQPSTWSDEFVEVMRRGDFAS